MTKPPSMNQNIKTYVTGKKWYWYLPLWLLGIYVFVQLLQFDPNAQFPFIIAVPQAFDFFLHEIAHIVTAFLPAVLTASAGSLSELLLGTLLLTMALKQRSYFAAYICALWFMLTCQSAGVYMADARAQKLALVSLGGVISGSDRAIHDWHFVFGKLHLLPFDVLIGDSIRGVGILVGLAGVAFGAYLLYKMAEAA